MCTCNFIFIKSVSFFKKARKQSTTLCAVGPLILNVNKIEKYMWGVETEIQLRPEVKYSFH